MFAAANTLKYSVASPPPNSPWPSTWYLRPRICVPPTSIPSPAIVDSATRACGPKRPRSIEYFRKNPTPMTRMRMPIRSSHWLATAYSIDTPSGTCSSPTMIQFQMRRSVSRAAASNRPGTRGSGAGTGSGSNPGVCARSNSEAAFAAAAAPVSSAPTSPAPAALAASSGSREGSMPNSGCRSSGGAGAAGSRGSTTTGAAGLEGARRAAPQPLAVRRLWAPP